MEATRRRQNDGKIKWKAKGSPGHLGSMHRVQTEEMKQTKYFRLEKKSRVEGTKTKGQGNERRTLDLIEHPVNLASSDGVHEETWPMEVFSG